MRSVTRIARQDRVRSERPLGTESLRTLVLVDLENLVGCEPAAAPASAWSAAVHDLFTDVSLSADDQIIVAVSPKWAFKAHSLIPGALLRCRKGADGADLALIDEVVDAAWVRSRFDRVIFASGDGIFAEHATRLIRAGVEVENASRPGQCSALLRLAVHRTQWLPAARQDLGSDAA